MKNGSKACQFCGSRFTFEEYELVDSMPADDPCTGCRQLYAILEQSAKRLTASPQLKAERDAALGLGTQDLSPSAILARLLANRRRGAAPETFDARMAAAGERD